jgi:hypothetical protein
MLVTHVKSVCEKQGGVGRHLKINTVFKAKHTFWSLFRKTRPENGAKPTAHFVGRIFLLMLQKELRRSRWNVSCAAWGTEEQYEKCHKKL